MNKNMSDRIRFSNSNNFKNTFLNFSKSLFLRIFYFILGGVIVAASTAVYATVGTFPKTADSAKTAESQLTHDEWNDIADFANVFTDVITVDSVNNKVGIGATNPSAPLDVTCNVADNGLQVINSNLGGYGPFFQGGGGSTGKYIFYARDKDTGNPFMVDDSGNVGIGTTSPNKKLHVKTSSGNAEIDIQSGSSGLWGIYQDDATDDLRFWNTDNRVVFTDDGNVGIGTSNPQNKLVISDSEGMGIEIAPNNIADEVVQYYYDRGTSNYGDVKFRATNYIWLKDTSGGEIMRLNSDGNVGIGTSSPSQKLHVYNGALIVDALDGTRDNGYSAFIYNRESTDDRSYGLLLQAGSTINDQALDIYDHDGSNLLMQVKGNGNSYIKGNVGIGTTAPADILHVKGGNIQGIRIESTSVAPVLDFYSASASNDARNFRISNQYNTGVFEIWKSDTKGAAPDDSSVFAINKDGNVGIGTTSPSSKLDLHGNIMITDGSGEIKFETASTHYNWRIAVQEQTSGAYEIHSGNVDSDATNDTWTQRFRVESNGNVIMSHNGGNVGIGTTSPKKKLHVDGDVYFQGVGTPKLIMESPDGTCSSCGPDNSDNFVCSSVVCP